MPPGMIQDLDHVRMLPTPATYLPAITPVVRFCRPAERDVVGAILSPSLALPVEESFRRAASISSKEREHPVSVQKLDAQLDGTGIELDTLSQGLSKGTSDQADAEATGPSVAKAVDESCATQDRQGSNLIPNEKRLSKNIVVMKRPQFSSITDTLARYDINIKRDDPSQRERALILRRISSTKASSVETTPSAEDGATAILRRDGREQSANCTDLVTAEVAKAAVLNQETYGRPRRLHLSGPRRSDSLDRALVQPIVTTVGRLALPEGSATPSSSEVESTAHKSKSQWQDRKDGDDPSSDSRYNQSFEIPTMNRTVYFSDVGDINGHPVLMFPILASTRYVTGFWDNMAKDLRLRLITVERPGQGRSEPLTEGVKLDFPRIVSELLKHLDVTQFAIFAHGEGAVYALQFTAFLATAVRPLVILMAPVLRHNLVAAPNTSGWKSTELSGRTSCLPCLRVGFKAAQKVQRGNEGFVIDKLVWRLSTSPIDFKHDLLQLESVRIERPLHKIPGRYKIVHLKNGRDGILEQHQYLQSWLHDCDLYEWHDSAKPSGSCIWEVQTLWLDVLTLLSANL